jgi:hypothetical protein
MSAREALRAVGFAWEPLGAVDPSALADARITVHWASQIVAAAGATLADARPDWSHTSMAWHPAKGALLGEPIGAQAHRAGLRVADLTLLVTDETGKIAASRSLSGMTLEEGLAWLAAALAEACDAPVTPVQRPMHDLPDDPVARGAAFPMPPEGEIGEIARWFADAHHLLEAVSRRLAGASPVRCWPHHFDIATLLACGEDAAGAAHSIGVGMSPGDGSYAEPYFYVTPWPYPKTPPNFSLDGGGHWHTDGWVGAVLSASNVIDRGERQAERALAFAATAIDACRALFDR